MDQNPVYIWTRGFGEKKPQRGELQVISVPGKWNKHEQVGGSKLALTFPWRVHTLPQHPFPWLPIPMSRSEECGAGGAGRTGDLLEQDLVAAGMPGLHVLQD